MLKKGKDPLLLYWQAYGYAMNGSVNDAIRVLESFRSRRELQLPISMALLHYHNMAALVDHEAIDGLKAELSVAEDVTKDAGFGLAARFALFTGDLQYALRLARDMLNKSARGGPPSTPFEWEAACIERWASAMNAIDKLRSGGSASDLRTEIQTIETLLRSQSGDKEVDLLMLLAKCKKAIKHTQDALNVYNQVCSLY
jgi:hypothetical protein